MTYQLKVEAMSNAITQRLQGREYTISYTTFHAASMQASAYTIASNSIKLSLFLHIAIKRSNYIICRLLIKYLFFRGLIKPLRLMTDDARLRSLTINQAYYLFMGYPVICTYITYINIFAYIIIHTNIHSIHKALYHQDITAHNIKT